MAKKKLTPGEVVSPDKEAGKWELSDFRWGTSEPIMITKAFGKLSMNGKPVKCPLSGEEVLPPTPAQMKALYDHSPTKAKYFIPPKGYKAPWLK